MLPTGLPSNPTYRKVNPADAPIMILALTSDTMTQGQMYDAASTILAQKLSQVERRRPGARSAAARCRRCASSSNPTALNKYGIGFDDVRAALAAANANRPKGSVEDGDRHWQIYANDQAQAAAEYLPLIVAYRNGAAVRLSRRRRGASIRCRTCATPGSANGKPAVLRRSSTASPAPTSSRPSTACATLLPHLRGVDPRRRSTSRS